MEVFSFSSKSEVHIVLFSFCLFILEDANILGIFPQASHLDFLTFWLIPPGRIGVS